MIILISYFIFFEIKSILRDGSTYFKDVFNYLDMLSIVANIYCLWVAMEGIHYEKGAEEAEIDGEDAGRLL